jgi:tetratricopeptide (TPR) repeat protein
MLTTRGKFLHCVKVLAVAVSLFLVGACSTAPMKGYTGPERPPSETALVKSAGAGTSIERCDGKKVTSNSVAVLPGDHTIEMSYFDRASESYSANNAFLKFTAEAGHTYILDRTLSSQPGRYEAFIMDQMTGKRVSITVIMPGDEKQSLANVEKAIKEYPQNPEFWAAKGYILARMKRYGEALPALETAISFKPDLAEAWFMKSGVLYELKRYDEALIAIDKAIQLRPNEPAFRQGKQDIMNRANSGT